MNEAGRTCAFVKLACEENLPWESVRYSDPQSLLDAFIFRSLGFCLAVEYKADFWAVKWRGEATNVRPGALREDPGGVKRMVRAHKNVVDWDDVPWGEYDMVISIGPIVPKRIVRKFPNVLWTYRETAIRCQRAEDAARGGPLGGYDLYADAMLRSRPTLKKLPQSVGMPYTQHPTMLRDLIGPTHEPAVFLDSRSVPLDKRKRTAQFAEFSSLCGLPIRHSLIEGRTTQPVRFFTELTAAKVPRQRRYLELLGACKYQVIRDFGKSQLLGDAVIEAVAMGVIPITHDEAIYGRMVCHPQSLLPRGSIWRRKLRRIQKIESNPGLQREILEHQTEALRRKFWAEPLAIYEKALRLKRA